MALTCMNAAMFLARPHVKRGQPTRRTLRTHLRGTSPRKRPGTPALVLARDAVRDPNVNMDPAET